MGLLVLSRRFSHHSKVVVLPPRRASVIRDSGVLQHSRRPTNVEGWHPEHVEYTPDRGDPRAPAHHGREKAEDLLHGPFK